jgi:hypothetical protein
MDLMRMRFRSPVVRPRKAAPEDGLEAAFTYGKP